MDGKSIKRTGKRRLRERVAQLLVTKGTIREIALEVGLGEDTIYRWKREPEFQQMMAAHRRELMSATIDRLVSTSLDAVEILHSIAKTPMAEDGNKVSASRSLLQYAVQAGAVADIEERLRAMEAGNGENE